MKTLLTTINSKYIHQNLAIRLLYELNKSNKNLYWKEFNSKENIDEIIAYCKDFQIVAFSCYIWNITLTIEIAERIKLLNPECNILLGGPEVSFEWNDVIYNKNIDFIIVGEGEIPFAQFLKAFPKIEDVPNLIWKKSDTIKVNKQSEILDLKYLKNINPYINEPVEDLKTKICYVESSRGCPHTCEFCLAGLEGKVRYFDIETVQNNLLYLMQYGKTIKFLDRTFNCNTKFAISIFKFILDNYKFQNIFQFEIKADIIQPELIEFIKSKVPKGAFRFEIGIQTLNITANNSIKRKQNFDNIKYFIEQISDKIEIHLDLIVGLPHDYWQDIKYSFEEVFKLFAPELQLGFLKFLKGTPVKNNFKEHEYFFHSLPPYQIIKSKYLSEEELNKIEALEHVLEIYWNRKRTINALKYIALNYSIFDYLLNLGLYFKEKVKSEHYDLKDVYSIMYEFSKAYFPENKIILEIIALDYYLQYKVKPQTLFIEEIDRLNKNKIIAQFHLNHHKFRFIILPISFNFKKFQSENIIVLTNENMVIQYDGINKPIVYENNTE